MSLPRRYPKQEIEQLEDHVLRDIGVTLLLLVTVLLLWAYW